MTEHYFLFSCNGVFDSFAAALCISRKRSDGTGSCHCHIGAPWAGRGWDPITGAGKTGNGPGWATLGGWALRQAQLRDWLLAGERKTIPTVTSLE